jgi:hypothetical protein
MASGNPEDFADWPGEVTNTAKANLTTYDKFMEVMNSNPDAPQHTIVYDERRTAFMTMEDFNKKWGKNESIQTDI